MSLKTRAKQFSSLAFLSFVLIEYVNCSSQGFQAQPFLSEASATSLISSTPAPPATTVPPVVTAPPQTPAGKVSVFMATGKIGRTIMSCDDGVTWINNRSDNENAKCWITGDPNYVECDHDPTSATGLDVGSDGYFYTQYGWGFDGTVRRSRNGVSWDIVRKGGWGGGLAVSNNVVVNIWESGWAQSKNKGSTWQPVGNFNFDHVFISKAGQKLFALGRLDGQLAVSLDSGDTWQVAAGFQAGWGGSFAEGNGVIVSIGTRSATGSPSLNFAARSADNGKTWTAVQLFQNQDWFTGLIFDGTYFVSFSAGRKWQSKDGINWTSAPFVIDKANAASWNGSLSFDPKTGTYVSILNVWGSWYANQKAMRSKDGLNWTLLDTQHFQGGHPIAKIVVGDMDASACGK